MNIFCRFFCRTYQVFFKVISYLLPWRKPELLEGGIAALPDFIKSQGLNSVLLITDKGIRSLGLIDNLLEGLKKADVACYVYDETVPNPTIDNIEEALRIYHEKSCQGIIAFGGGSPMDCAKGVGARVARPKKPVQKMKGLFKVLRKTPPFFAVPTTSGTGSEATLAAVITNSETHEKYAINDLKLIPDFAVLDPTITLNLPPHITSTTGIDALTHAVEAYIGRSNTRETREMARNAVQIIFENLKTVYDNGSDLEARGKMQLASYYAGIAFTRAYVGYVHALAHQLGGVYGTPHGLANAVLLPYLLEEFDESAWKPLAELAELIGVASSDDSQEMKAKKFIQAVKDLNSYTNIPDKFDFIKEGDIPLLAQRANSEANPLYPVPKLLCTKELEEIYRKASK